MSDNNIEIELNVPRLDDPVDVIPCEKLVIELHYLGIETIKEFIDRYDEIMLRILTRYPYFFFDAECQQDDIKEFLSYAE